MIKKIVNLVMVLLLIAVVSGCSGSAPRPAPVSDVGQITSYSINGTDGIINGDNITVTLPNGTKVANLVASFTYTGTQIKVGSIDQISDHTPNNFTIPVIYTVEGGNNTSVNYTVTVKVARPDQAEILDFTLRSSNSDIYSDNVTIHQSTHNIVVTMPVGTTADQLKSLVAKYIIAGKAVYVANIPQQNKVTPNDFTNSVVYTVEAFDGTKVNYTVSAVVAQLNQKEITSFVLRFKGSNAYTSNVKIDQADHTILVTMPYGTTADQIKMLIAKYSIIGKEMLVGGVVQQNDVTQHDFTNPVAYTVKAVDGTSQSYLVTVVIAPSNQAEITGFRLKTQNGNIKSSHVDIDQTTHAISVTMPYNTTPIQLTTLIASFNIIGKEVLVNGTVQTNNITENDFTNPVVYTVEAYSGEKVNYTVSVKIAKQDSKEIKSFTLKPLGGSYSNIVNINQNNHTIVVTMPYGITNKDLKNLIARFTIIGQGLFIGTKLQVDEVTQNDFTQPLTYTVTAADGSKLDYTVSVKVAKSNQRSITQYSLKTKGGVYNKSSVIDQTNHIISVVMPYGTTDTALHELIADFSYIGSGVYIGTTKQQSDITKNSFNAPVIYTVVADNGESTHYTVNVTIAPSNQKSISAFSLFDLGGHSATGQIDQTNHTISVVMPWNTNGLTALTATYTTSGESIYVNGNLQHNGHTENNFTNPLIYTVYAADGSSQGYTVTASIAAQDAKSINSFALKTSDGEPFESIGVIDQNAHTILVTMPYGVTPTQVQSMIANFAFTGESLLVGSVVQKDSITENDFTNPLTYTVVAADGSILSYVVTLIVEPPAWIQIGDTVTTNGNWIDLLAENRNNNIYVAYTDDEFTYVKGLHLFDVNPTWNFLNNGDFDFITPTSTRYLKMAFSNTYDELFIIYQDLFQENKNSARVQRTYLGGAWFDLGIPYLSIVHNGFTPTDFTNIVVNSAGVPYVAYQLRNVNSGTTIANQYDRNLTKPWPKLGSNGNNLSERSSWLSMALYIDGVTPYIAYADGQCSGCSLNAPKLTVQFFGSQDAWSSIGNTGFSDPNPSYTNMTFGGQYGVPVVGYLDQNLQVRLMKYEDIKIGWEHISQNGSNILSDYNSNSLNVIRDDAGNLYLAYIDRFCRINLRKYNWSLQTWANIKTTGLPAALSTCNVSDNSNLVRIAWMLKAGTTPSLYVAVNDASSINVYGHDL